MYNVVPRDGGQGDTEVLRLEAKIFRVDDFEIGTPSDADLSYIDQILRSPSPLVLFTSDQT